MRVTNLKDGTVARVSHRHVQGRTARRSIRVMDCMDCHNRPAHVFPTANDAVEKSLTAGALSAKLPEHQTRRRAGDDAKGNHHCRHAAQKITDFIRAKYSDAALATEVPAAIAEVQKIYAAIDLPRAKGRLARVSKQYWPQGLAGLFPLPRRQAQNPARPESRARATATRATPSSRKARAWTSRHSRPRA